MGNLELYNKYKQPPKEALKPFDNGKFKGTDINTQWRIKCLTEEFGEVGKGWFTDIKKMWREDTDTESVVFVELALHVKYGNDWSAPIIGIGGNTLKKYIKSKDTYTVSDEAYKMAYTDAFGNACKYLGIAAQVYWENDRTKYSEYTTPQEQKKDDRVKVLESIRGECPNDVLRELAKKHNCIPLKTATDENFAAYVKEVQQWKS